MKAKIAISIILCIFMIYANSSIAALPTERDISWTSQGGIKINNWLTIEEDYGLIVSPTTGLPMKNKILRETNNKIEYKNDVVKISKEWRIENNSLIVKQKIIPLNDIGKRSKLILKITALRKFDSFFTPNAFTAPKISGRWIKAGEMPSIDVPRGAYSNAMTYTILHSKTGSIMLDRVITNDYLAYEGGISGAKGDFSQIIWPMFAYGHWSWNLGHPGPKGSQQAWMENEYPKEGGSLEYRLNFFDNIPVRDLTSKCYSIYLRTRKQAADERGIYKGWEKYHRNPKGKIAFYSFVAYSWSSVAPWGVPGLGGNRKSGLKVSTPNYIKNLKRMRAILDKNGMQDAYIYLWIQGYDGKDAGWGQFPYDVKPVKTLFEQLRKQVHHIRLGLYVNFWICPIDAKVYKQHPEWFTKEFHWTDAGTRAYAGKLPEWGNWLVSQMPGLIKAYKLNFIFFDGADWASRWRGTHEQCRKFFENMSDVLHDNNAEFWANGNVPFVDIGMKEHVAGESLVSDYDLATNFKNISYHEQMMGPMFSWRSWRPVLFFRSGRSILKNFADRPEFIIRWPIHYYGEDMDYILKNFFTPYIKRRAKALSNSN